MSADTDIDAILAGGEDTFTSGGVTVAVTVMEHDGVVGEQGGDAGVICGAGYVLVRESIFPNLKTGDAVAVNGVARTVSQKMRIQDGRVLQVFLGDANV